MNIVDGLALGAMGFGYARGRKRGLGLEVYRLVNMGLPLLAGCGAFKLAGKFLAAIPGLGGENAGFMGFVVVIVGAFVLMRVLRKTLRSFLEKKFDRNSTAGKAGLVGLIRYALLAVGMITGAELSPADFLTDGSFIGGLVGRLVGSE